MMLTLTYAIAVPVHANAPKISGYLRRNHCSA